MITLLMQMLPRIFLIECTDEFTEVAASVQNQPIWNDTDTDRLHHDLLSTYDKFSRPNHNKETTNVSMKMVLRHIELDELKSVFSAGLWIMMVRFVCFGIISAMTASTTYGICDRTIMYFNICKI